MDDTQRSETLTGMPRTKPELAQRQVSRTLDTWSRPRNSAMLSRGRTSFDEKLIGSRFSRFNGLPFARGEQRFRFLSLRGRVKTHSAPLHSSLARSTSVRAEAHSAPNAVESRYSAVILILAVNQLRFLRGLVLGVLGYLSECAAHRKANVSRWLRSSCVSAIPRPMADNHSNRR